MTDYDKWKTTTPADDAPLTTCSYCGKELFAGDHVFDFYGEVWCDECIENVYGKKLKEED